MDLTGLLPRAFLHTRLLGAKSEGVLAIGQLDGKHGSQPGMATLEYDRIPH